mmetsp:Transcript_87107/g.172932  ORF Transcript_87107/g.172932 Transcript_87107/m.172932 type:complete len:158 (-) Transcript_87107:129-602(-)
MSGHLEVFLPSGASDLDSRVSCQVYRPRQASSRLFPDSAGGAQEHSHCASLEVVDEICLTSEDTVQSMATVIASCCCEVLFIPKDNFFVLLEEQPSLASLSRERAGVPAEAGPHVVQPLMAWSLAGFRSSLNWAPPDRSSSHRSMVLMEAGGGFYQQ